MNLKKAESIEFAESREELKELVEAFKSLKRALSHPTPDSWNDTVKEFDNANKHLWEARKRNQRFGELAGLIEKYMVSQPKRDGVIMAELQAVFAMATGFESELSNISRQINDARNLSAQALGANAAARGIGLSFTQIREHIGFAVGGLERVIVLLVKAIKLENSIRNASGK